MTTTIVVMRYISLGECSTYTGQASQIAFIFHCITMINKNQLLLVASPAWSNKTREKIM